MGQLITFSVDLTKFVEQKASTTKHTNGRTYANITISINDSTDQYGNNVNAWITQSKEEREAKEPRHFIGNGKVVFPKPDSASPTETTQVSNEQDDLPF